MAVTKSATFLVRTANDFALTFITLSIILHLSGIHLQCIGSPSRTHLKYSRKLWWGWTDLIVFISTHNCVLKCACTCLCVEMSLDYGKVSVVNYLPEWPFHVEAKFIYVIYTILQMDRLKKLLSSMSLFSS